MWPLPEVLDDASAPAILVPPVSEKQGTSSSICWTGTILLGLLGQGRYGEVCWTGNIWPGLLDREGTA